MQRKSARVPIRNKGVIAMAENKEGSSIFICWSGKRSKKVADAVAALLRKVPGLAKYDVFVSDELEKGTAWFEAIIERLRRSKAGVVCLTAENLESPWLHFEAGALASHFATVVSGDEQADTTRPLPVNDQQSRVFTLLHDAEVAQLKGPLSAYQATSTTLQEMSVLVQHLAKALGSDASGIPNDAWEAFQKAVNELTIPVREVIPDLELLFQRKSFNEPLHHCVDRAWVGRHIGVCLTRESLYVHLARVRAACPAHERELFEMLLAELDGYAMAIGSLLLESKKFELGKSGELVMNEGNEGIRTCCEDRRLAIRSLASRLLHPAGSPGREEAVRFTGSETDEERNMIVHRAEGEIRRKWEQTSALASKMQESSKWKQAIAKLMHLNDVENEAADR